MTYWYCIDCDKTIQEKYRLRHQASMSHRSKTQYIPPEIDPPRRSQRLSEMQECEICYEQKRRHSFKKCTQCVHSWCVKCNRKIIQCPFCRKKCEIPRAPRAPRVRVNTPIIDSASYVSVVDAIEFMGFIREIGRFVRELIIG